MPVLDAKASNIILENHDDGNDEVTLMNVEKNFKEPVMFLERKGIETKLL